MGPLAARGDPHRHGPGPQLVPARSFAEQPGQFCDVRFFDEAGPVRAARIGAGVIGAALADLPAVIEGFRTLSLSQLRSTFTSVTPHGSQAL